MAFPFTALSNPWSNVLVGASDMHTNIDIPANQVGDLMSRWMSLGGAVGAAPYGARLFAAGMSTPGATGVNIGFGSIFDDTYGTWDATNKWWVVPQAGLYHVWVMAAQTGTNAFQLELHGLPSPWTQPVGSGLAGNAANYGQQINAIGVFAGGEHLSVQAQVATFTPATTANRVRSCMVAVQIGY